MPRDGWSQQSCSSQEMEKQPRMQREAKGWTPSAKVNGNGRAGSLSFPSDGPLLLRAASPSHARFAFPFS